MSIDFFYDTALDGQFFSLNLIVSYPYVICMFPGVTLLLNLTTPEMPPTIKKMQEVAVDTSEIKNNHASSHRHRHARVSLNDKGEGVVKAGPDQPVQCKPDLRDLRK